MKLGRKRRRMETTVELNITAFMNLMVILVPFLLITAVFSRMTALELNLPALDAKVRENPELKLQLQLLLTEEFLVLQDANLGEIRRISRLENGAPVSDIQRKIWKPLTEVLLEVKSRFPEEQSISLLLERSVKYKTMIAVMDRLRSADVVQAATLQTVELFPLISVGDIPVLEEVSSPEQVGEGPEQ